MYKFTWYCRWCGIEYTPKKHTDRDSFCTTAHKQAHHRAYTSYVTGKKDPADLINDHKPAVTQKRKRK